MAESFPCIICGKTLDRVMDDYEAQPSDAVMCNTTGNYGSTVFDSIYGDEALHFNICDPCLIEAGDKGRVFYRKRGRLIREETLGIVAIERVERAYVKWNNSMEVDSAIETLSIEEIEKYQERLNFFLSIEEIKLYKKGFAG